MSTEATASAAAPRVIFYQLGQKFLDRQEDMPGEAKQVVYYSLAIGHHIGVIDCLQPIIRCTLAEYEAWISVLDAGAARSKLEGLSKWGEINIDISHTQLLAKAIDAARPAFDAQQAQWASALMDALQAIEQEPAIYLIARRRD